MSDPLLPPVFLERRMYRRRRVMDALRLLPILGVLLWMLPLFWPTATDAPGGPAPMRMSHAVIYVFVVWAGLIAASAALWFALHRSASLAADSDADTPREAGRGARREAR
ncbi:MAG: hypothetical protein AAFQ19_16405 [Pseudomonadota bacterium]